VQPEILLGLIILQKVFDTAQAELIITEVTGGKHSLNSLHYNGQAMDFRSKHLTERTCEVILSNSKIALGENFDFILEGAGTDNAHFHLEYDPKDIKQVAGYLKTILDKKENK